MPVERVVRGEEFLKDLYCMSLTVLSTNLFRECHEIFVNRKTRNIARSNTVPH
jgi:hypothetical protein